MLGAGETLESLAEQTQNTLEILTKEKAIQLKIMTHTRKNNRL